MFNHVRDIDVNVMKGMSRPVAFIRESFLLDTEEGTFQVFGNVGDWACNFVAGFRAFRKVENFLRDTFSK